MKEQGTDLHRVSNLCLTFPLKTLPYSEMKSNVFKCSLWRGKGNRFSIALF